MWSKAVTLFVAMMLMAPWSSAQSTFGGIVGVVKDPSQSAVAGAQLTLTNLEESSQRNATSDANGGFEFINLKPAHYELIVHADGFADYRISSMQLDARQSLRFDVPLKVATSTQTIEVSSDAGPVINTENGTIGDTKDFAQLTGLPVNYRGATTSPLAMLATVPGAQQDANGNVSVGGGLPSQVQYSVDGSSTVNIRQNGALGNMNPSSELISEFKVTQFNNNAEFSQIGDKVIISCVTACLKCDFCRKNMYSHCRHGGWILGNAIDGTQAEYVRIPQADGSLYHFPAGADEESMVMLSDILPTGFECGVINGQVKPGDTIAIVGAGPIGLAVLLTAQFYSPAAIFMIDLDEKRLAVARKFGATTLVNNSDGKAAQRVMELTDGAGVDVAIEAVGLPATFAICPAIVGAGGRIANVGVHGKPVELHMEKLWDRNISLTTRLVDTVTTSLLLKVVQSGKLQPKRLVTHRFAMSEIMKAYDTFGNAAIEGALKVVLKTGDTKSI